MGILSWSQVAQDGEYGGEQLGRRLSLLDSGARGGGGEEEEEGGGGRGCIPTSTSVYLTCESDKFVMSKHW